MCLGCLSRIGIQLRPEHLEEGVVRRLLSRHLLAVHGRLVDGVDHWEQFSHVLAGDRVAVLVRNALGGKSTSSAA